MKTVKSFYLLLIIAAIVFFTGCQSNDGQNKPAEVKKDTTAPASNKDASIPGSFSTQTVLKFDSSVIKTFIDSFPRFANFKEDLNQFYSSRKFAYAWFDQNGLIEPANNLYNRILNINDDGVTAQLPYQEIFTELMDAASNENKPSAKTDLMLTCQYLDYGNVVWKGVSDTAFNEMDWLLPRKKLSYAELLDSLTSNQLLNNEPVYRQYQSLKEALKKLRELQAKKMLPVIKTDKKKLQLGDSLQAVASIRQWLYLSGDLEDDNKSGVFDETLQQGVKNFQNRFGLKEDGIVGSNVIAEMNVPIETRIETIMVNMERSRWVPEKVEDDYLLINIPAYKLYVFENDSMIFNMNVVVGKSQHKTVIFNGDLKYVVFSPYWNVPSSILKNEILPAIRRNPRYLAQHNMEWNGNMVRQKPGPNNSLGLVKFLFPNSHSIYLHDSPAKSLFNETDRAFSHGCIRLSEPKKLAVYLLRNDPAWNDSSIITAMNSGKEKTVSLGKPLPVFIAYFTAWVDRNNHINFRKDVYSRDARLARLLLEKPRI